MKNKKKGLTFGLASIMLLSSFASCGVNEITFDEYENYDEFRFYAYMGPPPAGAGSGSLMDNPDYMTAQQYDWIKECGFNYGVAIYERTYAQTIKVLEEFEKRGMKFFLKDQNIDNLTNGYNDGSLTPEKESEYKAAFEKNLQEYLKYDSFAGIYGADEPTTPRFYGIGESAKYFYSLAGTDNKEWWVNLFGNSHNGGSATYVEHLEECVKTLADEPCGK